MKIDKTIIAEISLIVVFVALAILMYNYDLDLLFFKVYTTESLEQSKLSLEQKMGELSNKREEYKNAVSTLESTKTSYLNEKNRYEAISEETLHIISEATQGEEYNIEYMWIVLGNYAKENNLSIVMYEPDSTVTITDDSSSKDKDSATKEKDIQENLSKRNSKNMRIQVQGTYLNVSEFIYDVENDSELRFNLDNIRMEYMKDNQISAIFEVSGLVLKKN